MKKRYFSFWCVSILFLSSGIVVCAEKNPVLANIENLKQQKHMKREAYYALDEAEKVQSKDTYIKSMAALDQQIEQQEGIISGRGSVTNKWLWDAAKVIGVVAVAGLAAYNFLTTPSSTTLSVNVPVKPEVVSDQLLDTSLSNAPVPNMPISNTSANIQPQTSVQELFKNRALYNEFRSAVPLLALHGVVTGFIYAVFALPFSPVVPALFTVSALSAPVAYYYRGKLPVEMRNVLYRKGTHPTGWDYIQRVISQKLRGERSDLWKY
jgi:hypothetical protein